MELERGSGSGAGTPLDPVIDRSHRLGRFGRVRFGWDERDEAGLVPAATIEIFVDIEMCREPLEVDRRPQPEELRVGDRRTGCSTLADGADSPGAVTRTEGLAWP